ncbi:hypothetical protein BBJ28_00018162, partial [Nothophytophthora sp. Chile5]
MERAPWVRDHVDPRRRQTWSKRNDIKGHAPCPVKGLKEALRKRATVVSMDEFRTSKLCTQCHQTLSSATTSLEVPGRLKLAIQQVLEQTTPLYTEAPAYGYEEYYAAARPSTETHDREATEGGYNAGEETEQSLLACYTDGYDYATYDSAAGQYHYDPANSAATGAGDEHQQGEEVLQCDECDVVEAHAVEVESALGYEEGALVPDPSQCEGTVGGEPMGSIPATRIGEEVLTETWTCGQCTFLNPMAASFCEMCIGHISLSPEAQAAASGSSIATPEPEPVVYAESSAVRVSPPPTALYLPSAPDFESSYLSEDDAMALPAPPPYGVSCGGDGVDFLALAFNTNSPPKIKTPGSSPLAKASQMRREEATTATEHT